jgi:Holliday junction resolvasome RuvABC endonuclease subunit
MISNPNNYFRILAVSPSIWGFGFVVLEGNDTLVDWDAKGFRKDKDRECVREVEKLILQYEPSVVVFFNYETNLKRSPRIRKLNNQLIALVTKREVEVVLFSQEQVKQALCYGAEMTKHDIAKTVAERFPDELAFRLPPKRKAWMNQDRRMDIFDAAALAVAFRQMS